MTAGLAASRALARLPLARMLRTRRGWLSAGAWGALALGVALAARFQGAPHGADHVTVGLFGAVALPLACYGLAGACVGARSLRDAVSPLVAFGASGARAAAVTVGLVLASCAALGAVLGAATALVAHGVADPPRATDALVTAYAGALGGAAYGALFSLGASLGKRGGGRTAMLVVDWLIGGAGGAAGVVTPRANLRNLLGGAPPAHLPERASAVALVVLAIACASWAVRRARRA